jgi:hypothetical protein
MQIFLNLPQQVNKSPVQDILKFPWQLTKSSQ